MDQAWVSFDAIKEQVFIEDVLRRYGLFDSLQKKGVQLVGHCPFHYDSKPSFKVTPERNIWHCFGCNSGGDVIDLVRYFEGFTENERTADRRKAALLIAEWYGIVSKRPVVLSKQKAATAPVTSEARPVEEEPGREAVEHRIETPVNPPLTFKLKNIDADHPYLKERGLTDETIATFGLGFFGRKGSMHGRIVIPIHNEHGELVAYTGRWPGDAGWPEGEDKYKMPKGFYKSHLVYHLSAVIAKGQRAAVVVEGFFDCMKVTQAGFPAVAILGCDLSERQAELLCTHFERIALFLDGDQAGRTGTDQALMAIGRRGRYVRSVCVPDGCQPDELTVDAIKELLTMTGARDTTTYTGKEKT